MGIFDDFFPVLDIGKDLVSNMFADEQQRDSQNFAGDQAAQARGFNSAEALKQREWASGEAEKQRNWTELMSTRQYQHKMADLRASGLNPILAAAGGGNQIGSGAAASGAAASAAAGGAGIATPVNRPSVTASMQSASMINVNEALAEKSRAEAERARAEAEDIRDPTGGRIAERRQNIDHLLQQIGESAVRIEKIWTEKDNIQQATVNLKAELPRIAAHVQNLKAQTVETLTRSGLNEAQAKETHQRIQANLPQAERALMDLEATASRMQQPGLEASAAAADSATGWIGARIKALTGSLNGILLGAPRGRTTTIINQGRR